MLDVEIKQEIIALLDGGLSRRVENIFPFRVPEGGVITVNLRSDNPGTMELQSVEGGAVYLFRGPRTAKEIEKSVEEAEPWFDLAAAIGASATCNLEKGMGQISLFSKKTSLGFIRTCQYV